MSLEYLLDTNIISEPLRPKPSSRIVRQLRRHEDEIAIPSIVWHELLFGVERLVASRRREAIEKYLKEVVFVSIPILGYDSASADWHARERARLVGRGETPPFAGGQIAAIAATHDLTLVTLNDADFRRFRGLRVARWGE